MLQPHSPEPLHRAVGDSCCSSCSNRVGCRQAAGAGAAASTQKIEAAAPGAGEGARRSHICRTDCSSPFSQNGNSRSRICAARSEVAASAAASTLAPETGAIAASAGEGVRRQNASCGASSAEPLLLQLLSLQQQLLPLKPRGRELGNGSVLFCGSYWLRKQGCCGWG